MENRDLGLEVSKGDFRQTGWEDRLDRGIIPPIGIVSDGHDDGQASFSGLVNGLGGGRVLAVVVLEVPPGVIAERGGGEVGTEGLAPLQG